MSDLTTVKTAEISPCGLYRYRLTRRWAEGTLLPFVMLNPSTADADVDDPTIRRCMGFARREGFAGIEVVNLFALRATDPKALKASHVHSFGPANYDALSGIGRRKVPVVCAWGAGGSLFGGDRVTKKILTDNGARLMCLGKTAEGHPRHPLYVKSDQPLEPFP